MLCPQCQRRYPAGTLRCPTDSTVCLASFEEALAAGPMSVSQAVKIAIGVLEAIGPAHHDGRAYGGVSPSTVFFSYVERRMQVTLRLSTTAEPVPDSYRPPEMVAKRSTVALPASDLFNVAVLLHHAIAGRAPEPGQPLPALADDELQYVPPELDAVLAAMSAQDPSMRPTASDAIRSLAALELDSTVLGNELVRAAREASEVSAHAPEQMRVPNTPQRQIVFNPDGSDEADGHADTLIRIDGPLLEDVRQVDADRHASPVRPTGEADTTIMSSARHAGPGLRWWVVLAVLVLGAALGSIAVRWLVVEMS